jgi:transcriptional regulator with PAS, ATPase and Fis domain
VKSGVNASILITGESGTGKEFLAKHIASAFGKKADFSQYGRNTKRDR